MKESNKLGNEDDLLQRHKQEKKDLHSKIQSLKKSVPKGDKKKEKEVAEQISQLEKDLEDRHKSELLPYQASNSLDESEDKSYINVETSNDEIVENGTKSDLVENPRVSRAQRRRDKKASEEKLREERILEQAERNKVGPKAMEMSSIKEVLKEMGLTLYDIAADGNCLYCAVSHQLEVNNQESHSVIKLRKLTANFMRENKNDFIPFMYKDSGEPVCESYFEKYCKDVASTKIWGGQLELKALANILKCPIKVIQANSPPTILGEDFSGPELILTYHRHLYRLGEHYNSTMYMNSDN
ncbi:hypothetical protein WA026_001036 [Henosepilachna vigintioctopunctata]|uniref:OTU domain-containing protein n=1 Tax=Henosepilachna vigintioctopunctata TaxID=420089 RepID=A0AAW1V940_9CUCU